MSKSSESRDNIMGHQLHISQIYTMGNGPVEVVTTPPQGMFKVRNIYMNPANGRLVLEYDDEQ